MNRLPALLASAILVVACAGATSPAPDSPAGIALARADAARSTADPGRAAAAAEAINAFGLELYARMATEPGNLVLSPASVAIALSMARAGARGTTADEMDAVLHDLGSDEFAEAVNALDAALAARNGTFEDATGEHHDVTLRIANALFAQRDLELQAAFLDAMARRFGAGVRLVDYVADVEAARRAINDWVAGQTEDRIPEILEPGDVSEMTRLALANAIYLKAPWLSPFPEDNTAPGSFQLADGSSIQVPMMQLSETLPYADGDGWAAVELPYVGDELAMLVVVPDDLAAFEAGFGPAVLAEIVGSLETPQVDLWLPSFDIESRADLGELLAALGMPAAFDPSRADFGGITTQEQLFISAVIHQANMTVDEAGTEAAAATVVGMDTTSAPIDRVELRVDHPFLVVLRDRTTGAVVFLARVADPAATR
jgi:serpin B